MKSLKAQNPPAWAPNAQTLSAEPVKVLSQPSLIPFSVISILLLRTCLALYSSSSSKLLHKLFSIL